MTPPKKPFPSFKWRWAALTPTESLNEPSIFIGVLRAYAKHNGLHPGEQQVLDELQRVQSETSCGVDLVRTSERNLLRNSGQYWKALGVLGESHGKIAVTPLGYMLAQSDITKTEFSAAVIKSLELPNRSITSDTVEWDRIGLKIRPLQLILDVVKNLYTSAGGDNAYVTLEELIKVIIPLSGSFADMNRYVECLILFRNNKLNISKWPDCAPNARNARHAIIRDEIDEKCSD